MYGLLETNRFFKYNTRCYLEHGNSELTLFAQITANSYESENPKSEYPHIHHSPLIDVVVCTCSIIIRNVYLDRSLVIYTAREASALSLTVCFPYLELPTAIYTYIWCKLVKTVFSSRVRSQFPLQ